MTELQVLKVFQVLPVPMGLQDHKVFQVSQALTGLQDHKASQAQPVRKE